MIGDGQLKHWHLVAQGQLQGLGICRTLGTVEHVLHTGIVSGTATIVRSCLRKQSETIMNLVIQIQIESLCNVGKYMCFCLSFTLGVMIASLPHRPKCSKTSGNTSGPPGYQKL